MREEEVGRGRRGIEPLVSSILPPPLVLFFLTVALSFYIQVDTVSASIVSEF